MGFGVVLGHEVADVAAEDLGGHAEESGPGVVVAEFDLTYVVEAVSDALGKLSGGETRELATAPELVPV
jgi:hypothetical protein